MFNHYFSVPLLALGLLSLPACAQQTLVAKISPLPEKEQKPGLLDALYFGDDGSETAHALTSQNSDVVTGLLGQKSRRLLPLAPVSWQGGRTSFVLKVDPVKPNYFHIKLSGDDINENRLVLFVDGAQIGYRHLGDVELLDFGTWAPAYNGRFYTTTTPLPLSLTRGKSEVRFEIRSIGRIWGYGTTFDQFQKNLEAPTRGIYAVYSGTEGFFVPPSGEKQGAAPAQIPVRQTPGPEVMEAVKERVNKDVTGLMNGTKPLNQVQTLFLARAYGQKWTPAFVNAKAIERIQAGMDALFVAYRKDPKLATNDPATYNPDWFGFGPMAWALQTVQAQLVPTLDGSIPDENGQQVKRRDAYAQMFLAAREWNRKNRRLYTNQTMIKDLYGIYLGNRGLQIVGSDKAWPESQALRYLYEAVGLQEWRNHDADSTTTPWAVGPNYFQLTDKGLTKELGYVGTYGEVLDWVSQIFEATQTPQNPGGDAKIKAQVVKIAKARAFFREPALDEDGNRAMRLEQIVGWRDSHSPGEIAYGQRSSRDSTPLETASITNDPALIGYAQQLMEDNQFFASVRDTMKESGFRVTFGLLPLVEQYERFQTLAPTKIRLPLSYDAPDSFFADEEDGVVAIKNGSETLYASLYWRARYAVNGLARVHYSTPTLDRIAVVHEATQFTPSGLTYKRTDTTTTEGAGLGYGRAFDDAGEYGKIHSALAGEELPIAKIPDSVPFKAGDENVYAGKADFYQLSYGPYLIAMNTTKDKTFDLKAPVGALNLSNHQQVIAGTVLKVAPRTTIVLFGENIANLKTVATIAAPLVIAAPLATQAQTRSAIPSTRLSVDFNTERGDVSLRNGAHLGDDRSGVSGLAGDRAYTANVNANAPIPGPVALLNQPTLDASSDELTVTAWMKANGPQQKDASLFDLAGLYVIGDHPGEWTARVEAPNAEKKPYWFYSGKDAPDGSWTTPGEWKFFAFTWKRNGSVGTFYGATPQTEVSQTRQVVLPVVATRGVASRTNTDKVPEVIGNSSGQKLDRPFNGLLDNVRVYDRALTPQQLETIRQGDLKNVASAVGAAP